MKVDERYGVLNEPMYDEKNEGECRVGGGEEKAANYKARDHGVSRGSLECEKSCCGLSWNVK